MPLLWLSLAFLAGIIIADNAAFPIKTWLILAGVFVCMWLLVLIFQRIRAKRAFVPASPSPCVNLAPLLFLSLALGGLRYQLSLPNLSDPNFIASHNNSGERISLIGVVNSFPDLRDHYLYLRIQSEDIRPYGTTTQHEAVYGLLLVRLEPKTIYHYGDRLQLHGFLETPPEAEDFSYREYLARQGIYSYMGSARATLIASDQGNPLWVAIYQLKEKSLWTVHQLWPYPKSTLFAGILLGVETGIPEPVAQAFKETGTTHIIAISGFNMAIVSGLFAGFFGACLARARVPWPR